jgi:putative transcriptional regulator
MAKKDTIKKGATFGDEVVASLRDFTSRIASGETITVRTVRLDLEPAQFTAKDVKKLRHKLGVSQAVFAKLLAVSTKLVQHWESGIRPPSPMARRLLDEVKENPQHWIGKIARGRIAAAA